MTCTNPVGEIFPDTDSLHFKGFKFASPAWQAPAVFRANREISRTSAREREKGGEEIKESCLLPPLRVLLAWSKPAPATRLKIHRSLHSSVNPRTFIRIPSIYFRFRIQNLRQRTRPNRDVSVSDLHIFGERRETNSGVPKWWIPKNLL